MAQLGTAQFSPIRVVSAQLSSNHIGTAWFGTPGMLHWCPALALTVPVPVSVPVHAQGTLHRQGGERQRKTRNIPVALVSFAGKVVR